MASSVWEKVANVEGIALSGTNATGTQFNNAGAHAAKAASAQEQLGAIAEMKQAAQAMYGEKMAPQQQASTAGFLQNISVGTGAAVALSAMMPAAAGVIALGSALHTGAQVVSAMKNNGPSYFSDDADNDMSYTSYADNEMDAPSQQVVAPAPAPQMDIETQSLSVAKWGAAIQSVVDDMGFEEFIAEASNPELSPIEEALTRQYAKNTEQLQEIAASNEADYKMPSPGMSSPAPAAFA